MAVATEIVEAADGQRFSIGVEHISLAETGVSLLGENLRPVVINPDQTDLALVAEEMGLNVVMRDFNPLEKLVRVIRNPRKSLTYLIGLNVAKDFKKI